MSEKQKLGFCELLERSAEVLDGQANQIRARYRGKLAWPEVKDHCAELRSLAKQLRRSAKYHRPNPMGGPAVIFDACANAIRAGDPIKRAMDDYGLAFKRKKTER